MPPPPAPEGLDWFVDNKVSIHIDEDKTKCFNIQYIINIVLLGCCRVGNLKDKEFIAIAMKYHNKDWSRTLIWARCKIVSTT